MNGAIVCQTALQHQHSVIKSNTYFGPHIKVASLCKITTKQKIIAYVKGSWKVIFLLKSCNYERVMHRSSTKSASDS